MDRYYMDRNINFSQFLCILIVLMSPYKQFTDPVNNRNHNLYNLYILRSIVIIIDTFYETIYVWGNKSKYSENTKSNKKN